jgi:hypothetical protein
MANIVIYITKPNPRFKESEACRDLSDFGDRMVFNCRNGLPSELKDLRDHILEVRDVDAFGIDGVSSFMLDYIKLTLFSVDLEP